LDCLKFLIDCELDLGGFRIDTKDTPLHISSHNGYNEIVSYLLESEEKKPPLIDVNTINFNGATPLVKIKKK
jgi:ankyrin repeat protein